MTLFTVYFSPTCLRLLCCWHMDFCLNNLTCIIASSCLSCLKNVVCEVTEVISFFLFIAVWQIMQEPFLGLDHSSSRIYSQQTQRIVQRQRKLPKIAGVVVPFLVGHVFRVAVVGVGPAGVEKASASHSCLICVRNLFSSSLETRKMGFSQKFSFQ